LLQKRTNNHRDEPHALPKKRDCLPLMVHVIFLFIKKTRTPLILIHNCKKTNVKKTKSPLDLREKGVTPRAIR